MIEGAYERAYVEMSNLPLETRQLLQNGSLRDTVDVGKALFWKNRCESDDPGGLIGAQFNGVNLGPISIAYLTFGASVIIEPAPNEEHFIVQTTVAGSSTTKNGRRTITTHPHNVAVIDASQPTKICFERGCSHLVLKIDRSLIELKLQALLQKSINRRVSFELPSQRGSAGSSAWLQTMNFLCAYYDQPGQEILQNEHLLQSHIDLVATTLISSQQHNYSESLEDGRYIAAPRHVRRACEYIDENITRVISMSELCSVCNVTERTLQNGFKRYLGHTPSSFMQARKLHHLHQALKNAAGKENVSRIMWEYGISNPGRWANLYLRRYGCLPSETLHRSRR